MSLLDLAGAVSVRSGQVYRERRTGEQVRVDRVLVDGNPLMGALVAFAECATAAGQTVYIPLAAFAAKDSIWEPVLVPAAVLGREREDDHDLGGEGGGA